MLENILAAVIGRIDKRAMDQGNHLKDVYRRGKATAIGLIELRKRFEMLEEALHVEFEQSKVTKAQYVVKDTSDDAGNQ